MDSITIEKDKTLALDAVAAVKEKGGRLIFTNASAKDTKVGAAVAILSRNQSRDINLVNRYRINKRLNGLY